jgi:hypothetical protein
MGVLRKFALIIWGSPNAKECVWGTLFAACLFISFGSNSLFAEQRAAEKPIQPAALDFIGINEIKNLDPNLNGKDINIAVISRSSTYKDGQPQNDYRPDFTHNCLKNARFTFYDLQNPPPALSLHSTAICSILFGKDANGFDSTVGNFSYEGIVPQAGAHIYEFWRFLMENIFPLRQPDCNIITASFGNCCEQWWTRGIDAMAEKYGVTIIAGIGNGSKAYDPPLYPAAGSNVIGVGVVDSVNTGNPVTNISHFSLSFPEHSSFGPTGDGRCKPDIVAPGNCLTAADSKPFLYEPTGSFSSFATPVVAGTGALLMQKAKMDPNLSDALSPAGGNCVIKAILLNSATKLPFWHKGRLEKDDDHIVPLDFLQGAGMINAPAALRLLTAGQQKTGNVSSAGWDLNQLDNNGTRQNVYRVNLPDTGRKNLTATLVWNKHYNPSYPFEPLTRKDADLRLEIRAKKSNEPDKDFLLDYSNSAVDNLEHIHCRLDPNMADYEIIVSFSGKNAPDIGSSPYALAWLVNENQNQDSIFWYDINVDGIVDNLDTLALFERWVQTVKSPTLYFIGDINSDGTFDDKDIEILNSQMNRKADWLNNASFQLR